MYNKKAVEIWTNRLRRFVAGKRIMIVGNATSILNEKHGELIDSYDVVMRFGKGVPTEITYDYIGKRTDIWTFGVLRAGCYKSFADVPFKIFNIIQKPLYESSWDMSFPRCTLREDFQIYVDWFLTGDEKETRDIVTKAYERENIPLDNIRMSQGVFMILWLMEVIKGYKSIDIIGYDCMKSELKFDLGDMTNRYCSSWHLPVPCTGGPEGNPHSSEFDETVLHTLEDEGKIYWHKTDHTKVNLELIKQISDDLRPGLKNLKGVSNVGS